MKFGGTSVGSAERIRGVAARVRERLDQKPVVVVSALSGVTDLLIRGRAPRPRARPQGPRRPPGDPRSTQRRGARPRPRGRRAQSAARPRRRRGQGARDHLHRRALPGRADPALAGRHLGHGRAALVRDRRQPPSRPKACRRARWTRARSSSPTRPSAAPSPCWKRPAHRVHEIVRPLARSRAGPRPRRLHRHHPHRRHHHPGPRRLRLVGRDLRAPCSPPRRSRSGPTSTA